jgi:hypothetical protein
MQDVAPPEASEAAVELPTELMSPRIKTEVNQEGAAAASSAGGSAPRSSAMFVDYTDDEVLFVKEVLAPRKRARLNRTVATGSSASGTPAPTAAGPLPDAMMSDLQLYASQSAEVAELLRALAASRGDVNAAISEHRRVRQEQPRP